MMAALAIWRAWRFRFLPGLLCVCMLAACSSRIELLSEIQETEANDVLQALLEGGIKTQKVPGKDGAVSLSVDEADVARAIAILHAQGLPRERFAKMGEVFRKEGLISSPLEERARYLWALSQELSATLSQIDGVLVARAQVVLPERSSGGDPPLPSSASVFIKFRAGYHLDDVVPKIRQLVVNSIPGLTEEKVSIVLLPSMTKPADEAGSTAPLDKGGRSGMLRWVILAAVLLVLAALAYLGWRFRGSWRTGRTEPRAPATAEPVKTT
jgi:type III secretion protein J